MAYLVVPFLLFAACTGDVELPKGDPATPDIVFVSVDTLRADGLSSYGNSRPTTPFLDGLAARGTRFEHARSGSPWTLPSHTTMMSGQHAITHRVIEDSFSLDAGTPVLAQVMTERGYETGGFVATMYVSRLFGFDRGFDHFEDFDIHSEKRNLSGSVDAEQVIDEALDWLEDRPEGRPVFLFLHFYDVHWNYDPPEPYASMFDRAPRKGDKGYRHYYYYRKHPPEPAFLEHQRAQYDEAIRYLDDQLSRVGAALAAAGREARWVVTADHGEELGERGSWGHAHTLYAEQLHVPMIMSGPGLPEGQVSPQVVGLQDVAPTIAAWGGAGAGALHADGIDLAGVLAGEPGPTRLFPEETSRFSTARIGLFEGGLRLEWNLESAEKELFEPGSDPAETTDLARKRPEDVARLAARLEQAIGADWEAKRSGIVLTDGYVLKGGQRQRMVVSPGDRFAVVPFDAEVRFREAGEVRGPWKAEGGQRPGEGDALAWHSERGASQVELDAATRAALEALGYLQEETDPDEGVPEAQGDSP